jgi:Flp pilus assembly protein TadG
MALKFLTHWMARLIADQSGSFAPFFGLAIIPIIVSVGAAVDYSKANGVRTHLQAALDAAVLTGAKDGSSNWTKIASDFFNANVGNGVVASASGFSQDPNAIYRGTASATVQTAFLGLIHVPTMSVSVAASATASMPDNSCILTLDHGQPRTDVSLQLNGAPIINLSGCSIRSNTALNCNGHDGNVTKAIAAGVAAGCGNPKSYNNPVPDIYAPLASNITSVCGASRSGVTWTPGNLPVGAAFISTTVSGRTEYHVCGDLTLSGSGSLRGSSPSTDVLIVIENGSLNVANGASVSTSRTGIVLTGNNSYASVVNFPNGNGQQGTLTLSPPLDSNNPWQGVALFQDPALTKSVDNKWGPGANFNADGLIYLGNSNVVTDGNTSSSNANCSKFVMNSFTTNGSVNLNFDQTVASCAAIGLKQWGGIVVHLLQ